MTELPNELRALLDLTRDAHDPPDPEARIRVRQAIAASLLLSGGAASTSVYPGAAASNTQLLSAASKSSKVGWALFGSKLSTIAVGTIAAASLSFAAYSFTRQPAPTHPSAAPLQQQSAQLAAPPVMPSEPTAPEPVAPASAAPSPLPAVPSDGALKPRKTQHSAATLSAEMALLRTASEALAHGDENAALAQLREHGRRFPDGSLREERDGLRAIAECTRDDAPSAASAKRFLRQYPSSLLGARVSKACTGK
ncbi:MAG: hypothetical protein JWN04_2274 [Myxococcaceae bacterium]|nr:hypothetical protein [Myxococcaceae bacterium]